VTIRYFRAGRELTIADLRARDNGIMTLTWIRLNELRKADHPIDRFCSRAVKT
jgi:hypothetical protein